jgi:hypothetical protein
MTELRWIEASKDWLHGKFKLQQKLVRKGTGEHMWVDVPTVEEEKEKFWCEHIVFDGEYWMFEYEDGRSFPMYKGSKSFDHCPMCGAKRPE